MQGHTEEAAVPASPRDPAQVCYVFAVGRESAPLQEAARELIGPTSSAVRTVYAEGLGALVCDVPAGLYDEEGLKAQLEDLERLENLARSHHAVVAAAYEHTTVLPMRLATVYLDDTRVKEMLGERQAEFDALLTRLEGHLEWGVKIYADARAAAAPPVAEAPQDAGTGPGRAYLQRRRKQRDTHRDVYRAAGAVADRVAGLADGLAAAKVSHRPQQGELASGPGENTANDAYLVAAGRSDEFRAAIEGIAEDVPGVRVELTGPWAPYSFATPPSSPQPEAGGRQG